MSVESDSLIRMARWGREMGKRNVIADLGPLCEMADEIDRLRAERDVLLAACQAVVRFDAEQDGQLGWQAIEAQVFAAVTQVKSP